MFTITGGQGTITIGLEAQAQAAAAAARKKNNAHFVPDPVPVVDDEKELAKAREEHLRAQAVEQREQIKRLSAELTTALQRAAAAEFQQKLVTVQLDEERAVSAGYYERLEKNVAVAAVGPWKGQLDALIRDTVEEGPSILDGLTLGGAYEAFLVTWAEGLIQTGTTALREKAELELTLEWARARQKEAENAASAARAAQEKAERVASVLQVEVDTRGTEIIELNADLADAEQEISAGKHVYEALRQQYDKLVEHCKGLETDYNGIHETLSKLSAQLESEKETTRAHQEQRECDEKVVTALNAQVAKLKVASVWKDLAKKKLWDLPDPDYAEPAAVAAIDNEGGNVEGQLVQGTNGKLRRRKKTIEYTTSERLRLVQADSDRHQFHAVRFSKELGILRAEIKAKGERIAILESTLLKFKAKERNSEPAALLEIRDHAKELKREIKAAREQFGPEAGLSCDRCTTLFIANRSLEEQQTAIEFKFLAAHRDLKKKEEALTENAVRHARQQNEAENAMRTRLAVEEKALKSKLAIEEAAHVQTKGDLKNAEERLAQSQEANNRRNAARQTEIRELHNEKDRLNMALTGKERTITQLEDQIRTNRASTFSSSTPSERVECGDLSLRMLGALTNLIEKHRPGPQAAIVTEFRRLVEVIGSSPPGTPNTENYRALNELIRRPGTVTVAAADGRSVALPAIFQALDQSLTPVATIESGVWRMYAECLHPLVGLLCLLGNTVTKDDWRLVDQVAELKACHLQLMHAYSDIRDRTKLPSLLTPAIVEKISRSLWNPMPPREPGGESVTYARRIIDEGVACVRVNTAYAVELTEENKRLMADSVQLVAENARLTADLGAHRPDFDKNMFHNLDLCVKENEAKLASSPEWAVASANYLSSLKMAWDYAVRAANIGPIVFEASAVIVEAPAPKETVLTRSIPSSSTPDEEAENEEAPPPPPSQKKKRGLPPPRSFIPLKTRKAVVVVSSPLRQSPVWSN